jgi:thiosulfate dehydrogenase (quinone) large subunit
MNQEKKFALLRIGFGFVWAIDAWFKWQPAFLNSFVDQVSAMLTGQPGWIDSWIQLWVTLVSPHPYFFALIVALSETAVAVGLILGFYTRTALSGGIILSLIIWAVPEGFGGPYVAGSTDIGAGIIYVFVLLALWAGACWRAYSVDARIAKRNLNG